MFQDHPMAIDTKAGPVSIFPIWSSLIVSIQVHELDFSRYQMGYASMESQKEKIRFILIGPCLPF